jgi:hypothetical protein
MFSRPGALEVHVSEIHQEVIGLPLTSPLLLPSWIPSLTTHQQSPDLPVSVIPAEILTGACGGKWEITKDSERHQPQVIHTQHPLSSPKKYRKPGSSNGGKGLAAILFADLLKGSDMHGMWIGDLRANCLIQGRSIQIDLSRPQSMFPPEACIHKVSPKTIHYEVFEQRLEISEREERKDDSLVCNV